MYNAYFGFRENPFGLNPDPKFLYLSESHREAFAHLIYGVRVRACFVVITGDVGTGKTTLINVLIEKLPPETKKVHLTDPATTVDDLFYLIMKSLDLKVDGLSKGRFLWALDEFMKNKLPENEQVLLIVDEAQNLSPVMLEEIRLLSNLGTPTKRLFQILLAGQPELNHKLWMPELRQFRQRIGIKYHIEPLDLTETKNYIEHRLKVAGFDQSNLFHPKAIKEIYHFSKGYPRLINIMCDNCLITVYSRDLRQVTKDHVKQNIREIETSYTAVKKGIYQTASIEHNGEGKTHRRNRLSYGIPIALILMLLAVGIPYGIKINNQYGILKVATKSPSISEEQGIKGQLQPQNEKNEENIESKESIYPSKEQIESVVRDTIEPSEVYFGRRNSQIGDEALPALSKLALAIKSYPEAEVIIEGHTDNIGDEEFNKWLSMARAQSVKQWLIDHAGIDEFRLHVNALGQSKPKYSNNTAEGRRRNRRVEVIIR